MKYRNVNFGLVVLVFTSVLLGSTARLEAQHGNDHSKNHSKKAMKTVGVVKYKAHCGMVYSAAEAKKNRYICPMDHKPLKKIVDYKPVSGNDHKQKHDH